MANREVIAAPYLSVTRIVARKKEARLLEKSRASHVRIIFNRTDYSPERRNLVSMVVKRDLVIPADFSSAGGAGAVGSTGAGAAGSGTNFFGAGIGSGAGGHPTGPDGRVGIACGMGMRGCWPSGSTQYCTFPV